MKKMKTVLKIIALTLVMLITGCASEEAMVKKEADLKIPPKQEKQIKEAPKPKVVAQTHPGATLVIPKEEREVFNFILFKSDPPGAGIYVIDTASGKEANYLGTTPVRILVMKRKIETDGLRLITCTGISANVTGLPLAGKSGKIDYIEYQFKFRMQGYYDEIKIEKVPLNTDTVEATLTMPLVRVK